MQIATTPPLVHRVDRLATMLSISRVSVYRLVEAGELELVKTGIKSSGITHASLQKYCTTRGIEMLPECFHAGTPVL